MKKHSNNDSKQYFWEDIEITLNLLGLPKVNPIFAEDPFIDRDGDQVFVRYPQDYGGVIEVSGQLPPHYLWYIIDDTALRFSDVGALGDDIFPSALLVSHLDDAPIYVQTFVKAISRYYKKKMISIDDGLPISIEVSIHTKFNLAKNKEAILRTCAKWLIRESVPSWEIDQIIKQKEKPFRNALDEIIKLSGNKIPVNFSYCLACGKRIKYGKQFCDATMNGYGNKDNCRNKFRYWLGSRLQVSDLKEHEKLRQKYFKQLQDLVSIYPLSAFDIFTDKQPKLYENRYKERWDRGRKKN